MQRGYCRFTQKKQCKFHRVLTAYRENAIIGNNPHWF